MRFTLSNGVRKRFFILIVIAFMWGVGINWFFSRLVITLDDSTPYTFYLRSGSDYGGDYKKGEYVIVKGKKGTLAEGKLLTKRVMCVPGEVLYRKGLYFYCCGDESLAKCEFLHVAVEKTPKGRTIYPFNLCEGVTAYRSGCFSVVPRGEYYLGTNVSLGYDSRYVGFFKKEEILARLKPIF